MIIWIAGVRRWILVLLVLLLRRPSLWGLTLMMLTVVIMPRIWIWCVNVVRGIIAMVL